MRKTGFSACLIGFALCMLFGVLAALHVVGTDAGYYFRLQTEADVQERAGISDEDLLRLDEALSDCLKGDPNAFYTDAEEDVSAGIPLKATVFGEEQIAFNEKELTHMEDCRQLFILLRTAIRVCAVAGALLVTLGCLLLRNEPERIRRAAWLAPLLIALPLGALALWAAADFNAAFHFFHRMLFTNDLWLLDPRTDLLIRLCPASMFMRMGMRIGLCGLMWIFILPVIATVFTRVKKERR